MLTMDSGTLQKRLWQPLWLDEKKMLVKPLRGAQWSKENHHFVSVKGNPTDHFWKIRKSFDTSAWSEGVHTSRVAVHSTEKVTDQ